MPKHTKATNLLTISNRDARRLWLAANLIGLQPTEASDVVDIIRKLGFLQIDTVRNILRAHDHILWTRNQRYREGSVWQHLRSRELFEHFTHDASLIPMEIYPFWQCQFDRLGQKTAEAAWYQSGLAETEIQAIQNRIATEGPLSTHDFNGERRGGEMWARPPHKKALEQMWYAGVLATSHRENFIKYYTLGKRVFPTCRTPPPPKDQTAYLCQAAIDRLWLATASEIRRFWEAMSVAEANEWLTQSDLVPARVEDAQGKWHDSWALPDIETRLATLNATSNRIRIINPFDPAVRDRKRLHRLFGFEYKNEMFVPKSQRQWGYYVYPLLEGDKFIGRIELKGNRQNGQMQVVSFWPESGKRRSMSSGRTARLLAELARFARSGGLTLASDSDQRLT